MIDIVNAYNLLEEIELEESAKTDFIAKFGEETFNNFVKAKQRLANRGLSVDFGQYLKKSKEEVDNLILSLYDDEKDAQKKRALTGQTRNIRGKYKFLGEMDGYLVYNPLDHLASMDLGINTGWCTTGRYRHAGHPEFNPSEADAKQHFNSYTRNGCRFYYLLNPDTFYGEYALVFNSSTQADAYFEKHDDEVVYMYRKASQRISISSVYNAADMLVHSYPAEVKNIIQKIERTVNDDNSPEAKPEVMTTHKIINNFELDSDGVIMKFWGSEEDGNGATIPQEATGFDKDRLNSFLVDFRSKCGGAWLRNPEGSYFNIWKNHFNYLNSTLYCDKNCSFIDDLPVTCDVVDSKSGQLLRETKSPKELYYLRGIYNSGTSQNVRYFFVSRQKADDGMISVRADGTDWARNHSCEDMVLFRTRSDALEFSYNLFDRYPQYEIFAYKLADEKHAIAKEIVENTNLDDYVDANSSFGKCVVNRRNKYAKKKLKEGAASLDTSKVVDLIQECVHNFSNLIFPVKSDDNFEFSFGNFYGATYRQGTTSFGYDEDLGSFICKISFNGNLLREGLEDLFINTVYHELCHYAVWRMLVDSGVIEPRSKLGGPGAADGREAEFDKERQDNGHGPLWLEFAEKVNKNLSPRIMITPYVQDNEMDIVFDAYDEDEIDYEIGCTNEDCGNVMKFISLDTGDLEETFTAAIMYKSYVEKDPLVLMFDLAPSCKNCGSKLYIKIYNEQLKQFLEDYSDKVIRDFIVRKALGGN